MKRLTTFYLTAIAGLISLACIGLTNASADSLCEENLPHAATCPASKVVANNAKITGLTENAQFLLGEVVLAKCRSELLGEFMKSKGSHLGFWAQITKLLFTGCTGFCLTKHGYNLPYLALGLAAQLHVLISKGIEAAGPPGIQFSCTGAFCQYKASVEPILLQFSGDLLIANQIKLTQITKCPFFYTPEVLTFNASYLLTLDAAGKHETPLYITLL